MIAFSICPSTYGRPRNDSIVMGEHGFRRSPVGLLPRYDSGFSRLRTAGQGAVPKASVLPMQDKYSILEAWARSRWSGVQERVFQWSREVRLHCGPV